VIAEVDPSHYYFNTLRRKGARTPPRPSAAECRARFFFFRCVTNRGMRSWRSHGVNSTCCWRAFFFSFPCLPLPHGFLP